jgi:hypothetical protein
MAIDAALCRADAAMTRIDAVLMRHLRALTRRPTRYRRGKQKLILRLKVWKNILRHIFLCC